MNISDAQKKKLLAAAQIIDKGDFAVLEKLLEFQDLIEPLLVRVNKKDFSIPRDAFDELKRMIESFRSDISNHKDKTNSSISNISSSLETIKYELQTSLKKADKNHSEEITKLSQKIVSEINGIKSIIPSNPDFSTIHNRISEVESKIPTIPETVEETGVDIIQKINDTPIKPEYLIDIEHIKDLRRLLDEFTKNKTIPILGGALSGGGGRIVKSYDLSSLLDGVTKTFALPAFWRVISVTATSDPTTFRPTTDYTTDASAMTITFTSQISADSSLATGQTIIITYSE